MHAALQTTRSEPNSAFSVKTSSAGVRRNNEQNSNGARRQSVQRQIVMRTAGKAFVSIENTSEPAVRSRQAAQRGRDEQLRNSSSNAPVSSGAPLAGPLRRRLEESFQTNLGEVRVHTGTQAQKMAGNLSARAFTVGDDIFLGAGEQASDHGLLAHEAAHTVQQRGGVRILQEKGAADGGGALEAEADSAAAAVVQGQSFSVKGRTGGVAVQRQERSAPWYRRVAQAAGSVTEFTESVGWRLLEEFAPELVPIIRQGPLEWLKERISNAVESVFNTLMSPVRALTGIASSLAGHFTNLITWIRGAAARIARGDCGVFTEAADKIQQVFEGLAAPVIDRIKHLSDRVKGFFSGLWERFGAPVWQFLQRIGGQAWERIQQFGRWIWEKAAPLRRVLNSAWTWIKNKLGIGEGAEGQNGILQWLQGKAQYVWDQYIRPFYERYRRPILIVAGVLIMLSPAGSFIAIGAVIGGLAAGIRWIRRNLSTRDGVVRQRDVLRSTIIPGIINAVRGVSSFLLDKARFVAGKLTEVVSGLNEALGSVAGTILNFAVGILQWLVDRFRELVAWAIEGLMRLANWVANALERLVAFMQPVLEVLRSIARVIGNIMQLPMLLAGRVWNAIPACIRNPFIDFFIPLILRQIPFFSELAASPEAWRETRTQVMSLVRQVFRSHDLIGAMKTAFRLVVRVLRIPLDLMSQLLDKAATAWDAVLESPLRFIENSLKTILRGMGRFLRNILSHLWFGVQGWLLNAISESGVSPPSSWTDLRAVFGFVLDILGLSIDHVIELIDRRVPGAGRPLRAAVRFLSGALEWLKIAIEEGPRGLWRNLVDRLGNLGAMVLESAVGWIMNRVIANVSVRLTALAASAGLSAVLEAVKAIYNAIQTAIEYMPRILGILVRAFDTVIQIARGVIDPAAQMVESGLRMAMPVAIGFLANYAGLGGIGGRIREIILDIRERVDNAILGLIDRAIATIRSVLNMIRRGAQNLTSRLGAFWRNRRTVRANNRQATIYFTGSGRNARLLIASSPGIQYQNWLQTQFPNKNLLTDNQKVSYDEVLRVGTLIDQEKLVPVNSEAEELLQTSRLLPLLNTLAQNVITLIGTEPKPSPTAVAGQNTGLVERQRYFFIYPSNPRSDPFIGKVFDVILINNRWRIRYSNDGSEARHSAWAWVYTPERQPNFRIPTPPGAGSLTFTPIVVSKPMRTGRTTAYSGKAHKIKHTGLHLTSYSGAGEDLVGWDRIRAARRSPSGGWVQGHIINGRYGGPRAFYNLVPIPRTFNTTMWASVESKIRADLESGYEVKFDATVNYFSDSVTSDYGYASDFAASIILIVETRAPGSTAGFSIKPLPALPSISRPPKSDIEPSRLTE